MKRTFLPALYALMLAACALDFDDEDYLEDESTEPALDAVEQYATSNPMSPVVGYEQINLTTSWGSCGSHSGAVAIGKLKTNGKVADVTAIESSIYYNYGGRVYGGPGASKLTSVLNHYLSAKGLPWHAVLFHSSGSVLGYIQSGSPVIVNTTQWGGHYVTIYGLVGGYVYFSDGTQGDGLSSATLPRGNLKKWPWTTFLKYSKGNYIGFVHN